MIERRPFGRTGHSSTVTLFGGAALARASQADADRTLDQLLRYGVNHIDYGRAVRRLRAPTRAVDGAPPEGLLSRDEDRPPDRAQGPRGPPSLARAAARRPRRPDPAALARPSRRLGSGHGARRRARGADRGPRGGSRALHRRDWSRLDHRRDAPAEPRALRLRRRALAVQLLHGPRGALPEGLRGGAERLPGAERRGAGHQVDRSRPLGRRPDAHHVVPAPRGAAGHRPRGALGPRPARRLPEYGRRPDVASASPGRREPLRAPALRRRDGGDARLDADHVTVRPRDLRRASASSVSVRPRTARSLSL